AGMHNLATSYSDLGRHAAAAELLEQTLALRQAKLGPDHPDTLASMHNLANSYAALGRHADALRLHQQALTPLKVQLGADPPTTLTCPYAVAHDLVELGRGDEAVAIIDEWLRRATGKGLDPRLLPRMLTLRLRHFEKAADVAGCRQTARLWED